MTKWLEKEYKGDGTELYRMLLGWRKAKLMFLHFFFPNICYWTFSGKRVMDLTSHLFDPIQQFLSFCIHHGNTQPPIIIYIFSQILGCAACAQCQTDCSKPPLKALQPARGLACHWGAINRIIATRVLPNRFIARSEGARIKCSC